MPSSASGSDVGSIGLPAIEGDLPEPPSATADDVDLPPVPDSASEKSDDDDGAAGSVGSEKADDDADADEHVVDMEEMKEAVAAAQRIADLRAKLRETSAEERAAQIAALALANQRAETEYDKAMSEDLPELHKLDYAEAEAHWKAEAVTGINGEYLPFWKTELHELEHLGPGVGLWFRSLKGFGKFFAYCTIPIMIILCQYLYLYYNSDSDMDRSSTENLAELTTGVAAATSQDETMFGINMKTIMFVISCLDCLAILAFVIYAWRMKAKQDRYVRENDEAISSLPDYSVQAWNIPKDTEEADIKKHFQQYGVVADCVVVKDIGKVMGLRQRRAKLIDKLVSLKIDAAYYTAKGKSRLLRIQTKRITRQKEMIEKVNEKIEKKLSKGFHSVCAFITYEKPDGRAEVFTRFRKGTRYWGMNCCYDQSLKFQGWKLDVKRAPEASDLKWENVVRVNKKRDFTRKFIAMFFIFILLLGSIAVTIIGQSVASDAEPSVPCGTVEPSTETPAPLLSCTAIWNLKGENAFTNATSQAMLAVTKFVDNLDDASVCSDYISGVDWAQPMNNYAPYTSFQNAALPAANAWTGGPIPGSNADECAAKICQKCYCLDQVDMTNIKEVFEQFFSGTDNDFCQDVFDKVKNEAAVALGVIFMVSFTNYILMESAGWASKFERHSTVSRTEASEALYTFWALFINTAFVPILIYAKITALKGLPFVFQGSYDDMNADWYNTVMVSILSTAIINAIMFPLARVFNKLGKGLWRKMTRCCAHSQKTLNEMYVPDVFKLAERYGQAMCVLYYCVIFLSACPLLFPIGAITFLWMYAVDKFLLLKYYAMPPAYDHALNDMMLRYAPYAAWFHLAIAIWVFGYYQIPSYEIGGYGSSYGADSTATDGDYDSAPDQLDFVARIVRANAFVPFVLFVLLTATLFLSKILRIFVVTPIKKLCCGHEEDQVEDVPDFSELIMPGDPRFDKPLEEGAKMTSKLSGLKSYRLEDNPDYQALFPESVLTGETIQLEFEEPPEETPPEDQMMTISPHPLGRSATMKEPKRKRKKGDPHAKKDHFLDRSASTRV